MRALHTFTFTKAALSDNATAFYEIAKRYPVWAFSGQLGAGKTTFTAAICKHLNVKDAVSSPTFSIINEYHFEENGKDKTIFHSDWYRLSDEEEAINAGVEDMLHATNSICIVEWWEKAPALLPENTLYVAFGVIDENTRTITLSSEEHNKSAD